MNNLKSKLLKALMGVSLGALGAFVVTFVIYFWNLDMKLTSVMEGILLKHYDKIERAECAERHTHKGLEQLAFQIVHVRSACCQCETFAFCIFARMLYWIRFFQREGDPMIWASEIQTTCPAMYAGGCIQHPPA